VIAGGPVRAVIQAVGIPNVLTKSIGSHNPHNVVKATIAALEQLRDKNAVAELRTIPVDKLDLFQPKTQNSAPPLGRHRYTTMADGMIKIKLVRSPICAPEKHKAIVRSLGLKKLNRVVERPDRPEFRGMVKKVPHLLEIVEG
jgi:large subunit ribosomal protein L30